MNPLERTLEPPLTGAPVGVPFPSAPATRRAGSFVDSDPDADSARHLDSTLGFRVPEPRTSAIPVMRGPSEGFDPYLEPARPGLLAVLCLSHFFTDFCLGVTSPMIPSLRARYGLGLGDAAWIIAIMPLMSNFSQAPSGWLMSRSRTPWVLLACPVVCGLSFLVGLLEKPWQANLALCLAGVGVGAYHPFALLLAQTTMPRRPALSVSIFISTGFVGGATGAMVSGHWLENMGFAGFHYMFASVIPIIALYLVAGVPRIRLERFMHHGPATRAERTGPNGHVGPNGRGGPKERDEQARADLARSSAPSTQSIRSMQSISSIQSIPSSGAPALPTIPFGLLLLFGFLIAFEYGAFGFFVPVLFKDRYGSEGLGGDALFVLGVVGGIASYGYAWLADRGNAYRVAAWAQIAALPPMLAFFEFDSAPARILAMLGLGLTVGATFPLVASSARHARGLTVGLRMALVLGGSWGSATICHLALAQLPDRGVAIESIMKLACLGPIVAVPALFLAARRYASR